MPENILERLKFFLKSAIENQASDLHLVPNFPPFLRIERKLFPLPNQPVLTEKETQEIAFSILTPEQKEKFLAQKDIDFSFEFGEVRGRINIFFSREKISLAIRLIPKKVRTIEELNLPPILRYFCEKPQGFLLVCGPASHGKSTTLAALVEEINQKREAHIITIEDPIEYVFESKRSIIEQREVGKDVLSFAQGLKAALRQDPDVIVVGEMRDPESMAIALTAAETGHLVLSTLHTNSAAQTINRIVDSFEAEQQPQIKAQLAASLLGIVSERLLPRKKGGLIPACEILINTPAVANLIREGKIHEIPLVIETSAEEGMISLNQSLASLVKRKEIDLEVALRYSLAPQELKILLK